MNTNLEKIIIEVLTETERKQIDIVVKKVVKEYGETLRLLSEN